MNFKFTIGRKIGLGFGILIFMTIVAFVLTQITLNESRSKTDKVTEIYTPSVSALKELNLMIVQSHMLISNWVFIQSGADNPDKQKLQFLIMRDYPALRKRVIKISKNWSAEEKMSITSIFNSIDALFTTHNSIMMELNSFEAYEDATVLFPIKPLFDGGEIDLPTKNILEKLSTLIEVQQENAKSVTTDMLSSFEFLSSVVRNLGMLLLFGGILIALLTVRTIVNPIRELKKILLSMGKGVLPAERIKDRNDEIGEMSVALNGLVEGMRGTTDFAHEVGSGNFTSYYKPLSEQDNLGHALLKMRKDLNENEKMLEAKVVERTEEVVRQKEEIQNQNQTLGVLYKHVTDSIRYAKRIQEAILPPGHMVKKLLPNAFVLFKPKDIVSGDFYWMAEKNGKTLFAAVDCTGHGVPGAFMSIVGYNLLRHVVTNTDQTEPAAILDELNKGVSETLHQSSEDGSSKDGMDICLCSLDHRTLELQFAGAFNPLYLIRDGELKEIKGNKFPIGFFMGEEKKKFTNHIIQLQKGDCFYICSDGYADQFGGPRGKKFMANKFRHLLLEIHSFPIQEQKIKLDQAIEAWRGTQEQVDDILVMGVKV